MEKYVFNKKETYQNSTKPDSTIYKTIVQTTGICMHGELSEKCLYELYTKNFKIIAEKK